MKGTCDLQLWLWTFVTDFASFLLPSLTTPTRLKVHMQRHLLELNEQIIKATAAKETFPLVCPIPACKVRLANLQGYGNHLVDAHQINMFGHSGSRVGQLRRWSGVLDELAPVEQAKRLVAFRARQAEKKPPSNRKSKKIRMEDTGETAEQEEQDAQMNEEASYM